jgi:FkbM family methyltransferase
MEEIVNRAIVSAETKGKERVFKCGDLIYDIGMHKGEDSEFYLRKGFRVIAFEADPDLIAHCKNRLRKFLDCGQLTIVEGAIMDPRSGLSSVRFYKNRDISVWGTVCQDWAERNEHLGAESSVIEVRAVDLSDALRKYGIPHYMKVDIEGSDVVCLKALSGFEERPTYVSLESDMKSLANVARELELLSDLGYTSFQAIEQSRIPKKQRPPLPAAEGKYVRHKFEEGSSGLFGAELGGGWKSKDKILRQYRIIFWGYDLVGVRGVMNNWHFPGAGLCRFITRRLIGLLTRGGVPGWYDTHARLSS